MQNHSKLGSASAGIDRPDEAQRCHTWETGWGWDKASLTKRQDSQTANLTEGHPKLWAWVVMGRQLPVSRHPINPKELKIQRLPAYKMSNFPHTAA
mmetsp:Transcript_91264/g.190879  ORF Transcript_91264/g.190879 Transcript_91264/m.190879 type:complete len:96 (+) Transcript_91264:685-972(+)